MSKNSIQPLEVLKWGGTVAAFFLAYKTIKGLGLIPTNASNLNDSIEAKNYTLPTFWKQPAPAGKVVVLLTTSTVNQIIQDIWDSTGVFNDCESCMVGALKKLSYKTQYSYLVDKFAQQQNRDLTAFLKSYFNADELLPVWSYLDSLPTYKSAN